MAELKNLGKYEIRRELGRGAMGVVYEGYDPMIKRMVALKTIRADQLAGENAEIVVARFRREAQAAGRLNHPNIVSIYDFGEEQGVWYIAMEYIKGRELKEYFEANERFKPADIVRIMTQILTALGYSHRMGVIHRDVKPANIFVLDDGSVKVADFGIAHIDSSTMTQAGSVLGTPSYMSPEQILGLPIDGRSDLFSAGVILYQLLTGERPFTGSSTVTMHKVLEQEPLPPSRFNVQVPGAMDEVVRKALAKRPDERYQSAEEFTEALRVAAQREASAAAEPTVIGSADPTIIRAADVKAPAVASASAATANAAVSTRGDIPPLATHGNAAAAGAAASSSNGAAAAPPKKSQATAIAIVAAIVVVAAIAGLWTMLKPGAADSAKSANAGKAAVSAAAQPAATPSPPPPSALPKPSAGTMVISATGFVDPNDPKYANDKAQLSSDLRADAKGQLVAKALGLMLDGSSLANNYGVLRDRLMTKSATYVTSVVEESAPRLGKDGLMSMTTQAVVDVRALQKSLNQMSRDERIQFIRAGGDPRVAVRIVVSDVDQPGAPPLPSQLAENLLKERIKAFGFRTWSEDAPDGGQQADFLVQGEAQIKRLSTRLPASGVVITKYALNSWTVKCIDRMTGEEIYFNTKLPQVGSWASDGEALNAIGARIADEFSRDFFLQNVYVTGRRVTLKVEGMPAPSPEDMLWRELVGLPAVMTAMPQSTSGARAYDVTLAGSASPGDLVAVGVLKPLNAKLGQTCFTLGAVSSDAVTVVFDKACAEAPILSRMETNPPAAFYVAPPVRQKDVLRDPKLLQKVSI